MPTNNFIESSFWNFDALFQPQQHPARDAQDTFFISGLYSNLSGTQPEMPRTLSSYQVCIPTSAAPSQRCPGHFLHIRFVFQPQRHPARDAQDTFFISGLYSNPSSIQLEMPRTLSSYQVCTLASVTLGCTR